MVPKLLNTAWMLRNRPEAKAFQKATRSVAQAQSKILQEMVQRNQSSQYGSEYGFSSVRTPKDFQSRVPLTTYDDYETYVQRMAKGEAQVLTADVVSIFEPTSGSTNGRKLIPFTPSLGRQFQRAIAPWIEDLMSRRPAIRAGRAYWSISPAFGPPEKTESGIPIGFEDDTAYLGLAERTAVKKLLAVPPSVAKIPDIDNFRYCTLLYLLKATDLTLISIWSPTFLTRLLALIEEWEEQMAFDLRNGSITLPNPETQNEATRTVAKSHTIKRNTTHLLAALNSNATLPEKLCQIWPQLALVSCWTDAGAATYLPELKKMLPWVEIQPKGLIATEGCVSFPLFDRIGSALALRSHFYEFIEVDSAPADVVDSAKCFLAHELSLGSQYQVVITTAGGLYRYQLFDIVEVVGFYNDCPLLKFIGRSDSTCDLVGEKLNEIHVRTIVTRVCRECKLETEFTLVVPIHAKTPHYRLYIQLERVAQQQFDENLLATSLQDGLEENPYYRHAIEMHQLDPIDVHLMPSNRQSGWKFFESVCLERAQKAGDIKPKALDPWSGWEKAFEQFA